MADVGKKTAFDLVEFHQLLIGFLQLLTVLIQLEAQDKLPEAQTIKQIVPTDDNNTGECKKIEVVEEETGTGQGSAPRQAGNQIHKNHRADGKDSLEHAPMSDGADCQHN